MPDFDVIIPTDAGQLTRGLAVYLHRDDVLTEPGGIASWANRAVAANPPTQGTPADQPTIVNGGVDFDGTSDYLDFTLDIDGSVNDRSWLWLIDADDAAGNNDYLLDSATGPLTFAQLTSPSAGQSGYFDGVWSTSPLIPAFAGNQLLSFHLNTGTPQIWRDGTALATFTYTQRALTSPRLGAATGAPARFFDGRMFVVLGWNRELTANEKDFVHGILLEDAQWALTNGGRARVVPELVDWTDPADANRPSRINPTSGYPQRRWRNANGGLGWLQIQAVVGGVVGPPDSALGGRLFTNSVLEYPSGPPGILQDTGFSSIIDVDCSIPGHYTIVMRRDGGGAIAVHFDIES